MCLWSLVLKIFSKNCFSPIDFQLHNIPVACVKCVNTNIFTNFQNFGLEIYRHINNTLLHISAIKMCCYSLQLIRFFKFSWFYLRYLNYPPLITGTENKLVHSFRCHSTLQCIGYLHIRINSLTIRNRFFFVWDTKQSVYQSKKLLTFIKLVKIQPPKGWDRLSGGRIFLLFLINQTY